jgi:murein DD-endopeptidase MepM/ murein hydrolase activator NlpD
MKPNKNNTISVILVRGADNSNLSFNVNLNLLRLIAALVLVFVVALLLFIFYYGKISARFMMISEILKENEDLKEKDLKIEQLAGEIDKIRSYERKIKFITMNSAGENPEKTGPEAKAAALPVRDENAVEKDVNDFVQNIKLYRNLEYINIKDDNRKHQKVLESAPNLLPVDGWISRGYQNLLNDEKTDHPGIDIASAYNSPIKAAGPGIVTFAGWKKDLGFMAEIDHGYGFVSRYGHCARLIVKKGDLLERGQTIAFIGSSGRSSAPHLHFEIVKDGKRMDPLIFILK